MEHSNTLFCPACSGTRLNPHLTVQDYFLTQETFELLQCETCDLVFTSPRPSLDRIGAYYKSEEYVSHSSTKKGLVNSVYNWVRNYTLKKKVRLINSLVSGKRLLDIGAGTGHFLAKVNNSGYEGTGLEPDADARRVAKEINGVHLQDLSILHELENGNYDVVTMWHVLEHVYNLSEDLEKIAALVKPGGVFIVAVPNYTSFDATYYKEFWAAYDVPRHLYHFSPRSIVPLVEKFGWVHEKMLPMKFDSYYVSMLSEKYKGGSLVNALRIGLLSNWRSKGGKSSSQIYIFRKK